MITAVLCITSKAEIKAEVAPAIYEGQLFTLLDNYGSVYKWDENSEATPDDNLVLIPDNYTTANKGRYVFVYKWNNKREEIFTGTTDVNGNYTVSFNPPYTVAPFIVPVIPNQADKNQNVIISNITKDGFTVNAYTRPTVTSLPIIGSILGSVAVGLLGASNIPSNGLAVRVKVTEA